MNLKWHGKTEQRGRVDLTCFLYLQDFTKAEREEMEFGMQDVMGIMKAVLVEGMDRAISGVRA